MWYATRESVKSSVDVKFSAYFDARVDEALESASRKVDGLCGRSPGFFAPTIATRYFDWPRKNMSPSWTLWLESNYLISATSLVSGGVTIATADYDLRRSDDLDAPPYDRIEIDLSSTAAFSAGDTHQRSVAVTGLWGNTQEHVTATTLAEDLDTTETGADVANSNAVGVGDVIRVGTEYLEVTGRSMVDTGQNTSALTADKTGTSITGLTAGQIFSGEVLLIDGERMLVQDASGTTATVQRAYDGTTLAAHLVNTDIYAARTLTIVRGSLGSTASAHTTADAVTRLVFPGPVRQLARAYAIDQLMQEGAGYARVVGSGENERQATGRSIKDLEKDVRRDFKRTRTGVV